MLDRTVAELCSIIGHDGSEVLWPTLSEPLCRRGHHIEEIQYAAYYIGYLFVPFVAKFEYNPGASEELPFVQYDLSGKFQIMLGRYDGILVGEYKRGTPHAVAWNAREGCIYDPDGIIVDSKRNTFLPECFYARITGTR